MSNVLALSDLRMLAHDSGPHHPERPGRLKAVVEALQSATGRQLQWRREVRPATREELLRVHDAAYVDFIDSTHGRSAALDADTHVSPGSVEAALLAAGAAVEAVEALMSGSANSAVVLVRPPGHHAERDRAMGFCLFNNIAVAAAHAIEELGCRRVMIVDWDVHHGNGTQHMFEARPDVLFLSTHQWPLYPGTGAAEEIGRGDGEGFTVNIPLPAGMGDADYAAVFREIVVPIGDTYRPDLVLVSGGFDAHEADPLAGMRVTSDGFALLCGMVRGIASRHAGGRLALILEGGYDLAGLATSVKACVETMTSDCVPVMPVPAASEPLSPAARRSIDRVCEVQGRHWPL